MDNLLPSFLNSTILVDYVLVGPVFPFLHLGHALYVFNGYKPLLKDKPWFLSLVICMIHLFFGGSIRSILLGMRPSVWESNLVLPTMIVFWYLLGSIFRQHIT
jgi:hypothetical protein